jgi:hypothetical protein
MKKNENGEFQRSPELGKRFCVSFLPSNYETFYLSYSQFLNLRYLTSLHVRDPIADIIREIKVMRDDAEGHAQVLPRST